MTRLDCNVCGCAYNEDDCCRRSHITVEGESACVCPETCCSSFAPEGCDCEADDCGCAEKETEVACDAVECMYNSMRQCHANHIGISGRHADTVGQTECASFRLS